MWSIVSLGPGAITPSRGVVSECTGSSGSSHSRRGRGRKCGEAWGAHPDRQMFRRAFGGPQGTASSSPTAPISNKQNASNTSCRSMDTVHPWSSPGRSPESMELESTIATDDPYQALALPVEREPGRRHSPKKRRSNSSASSIGSTPYGSQARHRCEPAPLRGPPLHRRPGTLLPRTHRRLQRRDTHGKMHPRLNRQAATGRALPPGSHP